MTTTNISVYRALITLLAYYCLYDLTSVHSILSSNLSNLVVLIVLGLLAFYLVVSNNMRIFASRSLFWAPFIFVLVINLMDYTMPKSYVLLHVIFVLIISNPFIDISSFRGVMKWFKIMGIIAGVGVMFQLGLPQVHLMIIRMYLSGEGVDYVTGYATRGYYSGFFHQVGDAAFYVSASIISCLYMMDKSRKRTCLLLFLFVILFMLGKRSLVLFLIAAILVTYIVMGDTGSRRIFRIASATLFSIVFILVLKQVSELFLDVKFFEKIAYTLNFLAEGNTNDLLEQSGRLNLYDYAKELFWTNKWTGIGWAQFSNKITQVLPSGTSLSVHNIYLQLLCETGIVGFTAFIVGVLSSLYACVKSKRLLNFYNGRNKTYLEKVYSVSLTGQVLFILYGFVENPLYNEDNLIFYFILIFMNYVLLECLRNYKNSKQFV